MAVALGIGAAVFTGAGVATADDGATASSSSSSAADTSAASKPERSPGTPSKQSSEKTTHESVDRTSSTSEAAADDAPVAKKKKSASSHPEKGAPAEAAPDPVVSPVAAAPEVEPAAPVAEPVVATTPDVPVVDPVAPAVVEVVTPVVKPAEVASTVISNVVSPLLDIGSGDQPGDPAKSALALTLVGTSRKEAGEESVETAGLQTTNSLVDSTATQYPTPTGVEIIPWTPPLEWLQNIPVIGRFIVTPLVGLLHVIPLISDVLHPIFGFPIDHDAPEGAPKARSFFIKSFDGTKIFVNFMPAKNLPDGQIAAPTILDGPGLGLPGSTALDVKTDSLLPTDVIGIGALRDAGYNVVTWDPRGEWRSTGRMQLQSPDFEGRDISYLISYLATLPEVARDGENDPKIGMVGASYGGGIQLATAAIDHRIDAIVPTIAWNSLDNVLFPDGAVRSGWGTLLSAALVFTLSRPNPRILPAAIIGILTGKASQADLDLLINRGYADQLGDITTPTLLFQGTVDTLFTLKQADLNAQGLVNAEALKVVWYCGGHGTCLSSYNNGDVVFDRTMDWLNKYVKDEDVDTGPGFEWVDQTGQLYSSEDYPAPESTTPVTAERTDPKTIAYFPFIGGSGPNPLIITRGLIAVILGLPSAAPATNAVNLHVPDATETTHIIGTPELTLTYSGHGNATHVYAQIVDDETHLVLGNLATSIPVVLDGQSHQITYDLEEVAHTLKPGQSVTVQVMTSTINFLNFYSWGTIRVEGMSIKLPTLGTAAVATVAA